MTLLAGFRMVQLGPGRAAAVCGRLLADAGATVTAVDPALSTPLEIYLNTGKSTADDEGAANPAIAAADLIVCEGAPGHLRDQGRDTDSLRKTNKTAAIVLISNFGQTGPRADEPAADLTLFYASGMARLLTGQVTDLAEPPMRPVGEQSTFLGGVAAACAGMHAVLFPGDDATVDISIQEVLATLAITELTRAGLTGRSWSRKRVKDGNGATVTILPAKNGYTAISPREPASFISSKKAVSSLASRAVEAQQHSAHGLALRHQAGPRRKLGRAARAYVAMEPRPRQAVDRRHRAGGACAKLSTARTGRATRVAAARTPRLLCDARPRWPGGENTVRTVQTGLLRRNGNTP